MQPEELIQIARSAAEKPRTPYARFPVGAAVEGADGQIYCGCNIVSASYPLSICAERVAIFSAIAAGTMPHRLAVSCLRGDPSDPGSLMPCGACRQVMLDQMPPDATVIVDGVGEFTVGNLLPIGFHLPFRPSPLEGEGQGVRGS
jgi:cytidine deaminase